MFYDSRIAFDPITCIHIKNIAHLFIGCAVNMATQDNIRTIATPVLRHSAPPAAQRLGGQIRRKYGRC